MAHVQEGTNGLATGQASFYMLVTSLFITDVYKEASVMEGTAVARATSMCTPGPSNAYTTTATIESSIHGLIVKIRLRKHVLSAR
jgi:hypothetical protein